MIDAIFRNRVDNFTPDIYKQIMKKFKKELTATVDGDSTIVIYKHKKRKVHLFTYNTYSMVAYTDLKDEQLLSMSHGKNPFNESIFDEVVNSILVD